VVVVSALVDSLPVGALVPDQPPEAVQDVAFVEDQLSVEDKPFATTIGLAVSDTPAGGGGGGGGGVPGTVTVADALPLPPELSLQVRK